MKNWIARVALVAAAAALSPAPAQAAVLVVNVTGIQTNGPRNAPGNTVQFFNIGAGSRVTDSAYNFNLTAFDPSWLSEATVRFTDSAGVAGVRLRPGFGDDTAGTRSYSGSADLEALGFAFNVGQDGLLRLEYYENPDDASVNPDARFNSGTLNFTYDLAAVAPAPEPAAWALAIGGFGAAGGVLRRRRRVAVRAAHA